MLINNKSCSKLNGCANQLVLKMDILHLSCILILLLQSVHTFDVQVFNTIDSASENYTIDSGRIRHNKDIFHLLIINQTLRHLDANFIQIQNELSILQIINSSVEHISPAAFNVTPTLTLLRITLNPLTTVKKHIFNHIKVKEIDLSQNAIAHIEPEAFDNNTNLEIVILNNNQIKEINPNWFLNSPNVYKLSVVFNDITQIPAEAFKNMAQNRPLKLRLSSNRITQINPDALNSHRNIQLLRINGNKLTTLPENMFVNRTIQVLLVNMNKLMCFPDVIFNSTIATLAFVDNLTFQCDCLKKVREFAEHNHVEVLYPSVICEDRAREVNIVFSYNRTYEIPLLPPIVDT